MLRPINDKYPRCVGNNILVIYFACYLYSLSLVMKIHPSLVLVLLEKKSEKKPHINKLVEAYQIILFFMVQNH